MDAPATAGTSLSDLSASTSLPTPTPPSTPCLHAPLSPPTLTTIEQATILAAPAGHPRDHMTYWLALGTGLRLAEIVGLSVGDIYSPEGTPRSRVRVRPEIAEGGRAGDVFLPDALLPKLRRYKRTRGERRAPREPLLCSQVGRSSTTLST